MLHVALHLLVPASAALAFFPSRRLWALGWLLAGLAVDVDHLLADPIYDPARCSMGFHPLHTGAAVAAYAVLTVAAGLAAGTLRSPRAVAALGAAHLLGLGLLIHMALDLADCVL